MNNNKTIGQRIRDLRDEKSISLRDFAIKLNLSPAFVSDVELGRRYPSEDIIQKMASALGVKLKELEAYDPKPIVEEIKRRSLQADPELGILMRSDLKTDKDFDALKKYLRDRKDKK
jgi:transcriptional regulator with XRE-family HTH domain